MATISRFTASLLVFAFHPLDATASRGEVERFDTAVARLSAPGDPSVAAQSRTERSAADFVLERRLNIQIDFPGEATGSMYGGLFQGKPAVFTRSGDRLAATVVQNGQVEVTFFDGATGGDGPGDSASGSANPRSPRLPRSVGPGHFEDPAAFNLHINFLKHDDLADRSIWDIHVRFVAAWLADLAKNVLPVEPVRISYAERVPWITDMAYGDADSLEAFERTLKAVDVYHRLGVDRTYKKKFVLLTAQRPMPGTTGVAFQGGNEAIASVLGRARIVAHEIGHMLGATHESAVARGWLGCETNMVATASSLRSDCLKYSAANERAVRSYMRHGPDTSAPRQLADAPAAE